MTEHQGRPDNRRERAFNAPAVVIATIALFGAIHLWRVFLSEDADIAVLLRFAFIPARYDPASPYLPGMLGGEGAKLWTFLTYALLHGDWTHLLVNSVAMLAFGSAVAWRFGPLRFLFFSALCAIGGAAAYLALHLDEPQPVSGASAAISGQMAAAMRFMFEAGGPLGAFRRRGRLAFSAPAVPLAPALRNPQVLIFLLAWFGTNIVFGLGGMAIAGETAAIAWEAHIGGFLTGLVLFPLFDPKVARFRDRADASVALPSRPPAPHD
ncbi:membrane associated rhomboid family serine protease [Methylopila capsulata]|uniref:Membrane associated rhomboid family serine protease n=1 Tax=Methylopila capsulata TaxID=61654 RepID=A0A9W6ITC5_9HYPH|nr:rhomboid family intramembrane serine protease [Methylopila capsulata]MBM7850542.1 membrane associated rhomboid family serine protease [Methylopila capsulata]GLK55838.1 hypothetical protein GCM10008170_18570 [Methylopila capsulata]